MLVATFTLAVTAGDLLVAAVRATGTVAVSDNVNGTWQKAWGPITNNHQFYFLNSGAAEANGLTVTVTDTSTDTIRLIASRYTSDVSVTWALDQTSTNEATATTSWTAGNTAAVAADEVVIASWGIDVGVSAGFTAGATNGINMTIPANGTTGTSVLGESGLEYALSSAAGAQTSSATSTLLATWHGGQATYAATIIGTVQFMLLMAGGPQG